MMSQEEMYYLSDAPLEADSTESDRDSALGDEAFSRTQSLTESIFDFRFENGRRYHAYLDGRYHLPNDDIEAERLDLQHHLFRISIDGKLHIAPIPQNVQEVLDVGCGTGIWGIDFADMYPSARVLGIDLSPIQPTLVPPNCSFLIDDAEGEWQFDQKFDFIHSRAMTAGFRNWAKFFQQSYDYLKPGGHIECQEVAFPARSEANSSPPNSAFNEWNENMIKAALKTGFDFQAPRNFGNWLRDVGFVNIHCRHYKWPLGTWPKGSREKKLGRWALENAMKGLQGGTLAFFTRVLGWTADQVEVNLAEVRKELRARKSHFFLDVYFWWAQKPQFDKQSALKNAEEVDATARTELARTSNPESTD